MKRFIFSLLACATTSFAGDAGLQLYSLRDIFKTDTAGSLDKVKAFGVKHYFIEDEHPEAATQIPQSLKYLNTLK